MTLLKQDRMRYEKRGDMPRFQYYFRKAQDAGNPLTKNLYRFLYLHSSNRAHVRISTRCRIGGGLYIGHPYGINVNEKAVIGRNCNIHKGVTIGQENRGERKGCPTLGNEVWIGVNATVVGRITIGDDVLIAPNSFVNRDIPSHSVVFGNPCMIKPKENATAGYINNKVPGEGERL